MHISSMTQKGQVTIPASMRELLDLQRGDQVEFLIERDQIVLRKHTQPVEELFGMFKVKRGASDQDILDGIVKGASRGCRS